MPQLKLVPLVTGPILKVMKNDRVSGFIKGQGLRKLLGGAVPYFNIFLYINFLGVTSNEARAYVNFGKSK